MLAIVLVVPPLVMPAGGVLEEAAVDGLDGGIGLVMVLAAVLVTEEVTGGEVAAGVGLGEV